MSEENRCSLLDQAPDILSFLRTYVLPGSITAFGSCTFGKARLQAVAR